MVLNWANFLFANLVRGIRRTVTKHDWLEAESSPVDEEEIKIKMDDGLVRYFTRFGGIFKIYLLTCERCSLVSGTQGDIVVS